MHWSIRLVIWLMTSIVACALLSCGDGGGGGGAAITLSYQTSLTSAQQAAFEAAATRLNKVIAGSKLTSVKVNGPCSDGTTSVPINETIDGIVILVSVRDLGSTSILAETGPCLVRGTSKLPLVSVMNLNSNTLGSMTDANLRKMVLHEMHHALGFGTIWDTVTPSLLDATTHAFSGAQALSAAKTDNGALSSWTTVPVENCVGAPGTCGTGTIDSHWRASVFGTELMTGWITSGTQALSATTIASLGDLGYTVDLTQADAFTVPNPSALRALEVAESPVLDLNGDVLQVAPVVVDDSVPMAP